MRLLFLALMFVVLMPLLVASSHVAEGYKTSLYTDASATLTRDWREKDARLHSFLAQEIPEALEHTGSAAFDEHLRGVQSVLRIFGADEDVCNAGLFHSIYGTEGFQGTFKLPFSRRGEIENLIGKRAERLVFAFCVVDRLEIDKLVEKCCKLLHDDDNKQQLGFACSPLQVAARVELGRFPVRFQDKSEFLDFIELTLADWLEQVEGASEKVNISYEWRIGEAWSYRRNAFANMAKLLVAERGQRLLIAQRMHRDVFDAEPLETRHLVQERTPPQSDAAKEAREALLSADDFA